VSTLSELFFHLTLSSLLDIFLVALVLFALFFLMKGTRAVQLLRGMILVVSLAVIASNLFQLTAFSWLIRNMIPALLISIPVLFQPELRRALERLGRGALFTRGQTAPSPVINAIVRAASELAKNRCGALMVLEGKTGLQEFVDTGVALDAKLSADLLLSLFAKSAALHDGAVIIREDRIAAAMCVLPLSESPSPEHEYGTRHRAAIGITEGTDATAIVVSEESGQIAVAHSGRLVRRLDEGELNRVLLRLRQPIAAKMNERARQ